jgi:ankyrin repeat protein
MTGNLRLKEDASPALLKLPNELLFDIASYLSIPDIRHLSRVSRRFYFFAREYLIRYRYNSGLVTLPNEIILEVVQLLGTQKARSRFARTSQRFYPLVMNYVVRHNIRCGGSSLLNYASKRNLKGMAQRILHLGGNVNAQKGSPIVFAGEGATPLTTAAYYGYERMVRLFLKTGARQRIGEYHAPLAVAMVRGHENVALILSQQLGANDTLRRNGSTVLQHACDAKFVNLLRYLLERDPTRPNEQSIHDRSIALYRLLGKTACKGEFVKRELLEDVYQIAMMLLRHGADPDIRVKETKQVSETARHVASRHPDPRVRTVLSRARVVPLIRPEGSNSRIQLFTTNPRATSASDELRSREFSLGDDYHATLWDFLERPGSDVPTPSDGDRSTAAVPDELAEDNTLDSSDIQALICADMERLMAKSETSMNPPPLSSFPQLGTSRAIRQHADQEFWAQMPVNAIRSDLPSKKPAQKAK